MFTTLNERVPSGPFALDAGDKHEISILLEAVRDDIGDLDAVRAAVAGCDSVVHLAGDPRVSAPWADLRIPNVDGVYHVFEAARAAGVMRVVFASSNHVTGMLDKRRQWSIVPDSLYGACKAFGEALARYYAETTDLSVVCLRIGWVHDTELPDNPAWLRMWLSERDLGQLAYLIPAEAPERMK